MNGIDIGQNQHGSESKLSMAIWGANKVMIETLRHGYNMVEESLTLPKILQKDMCLIINGCLVKRINTTEIDRKFYTITFLSPPCFFGYYPLFPNS